MISVARVYWCSRTAVASGSGSRFKRYCTFAAKAMDKVRFYAEYIYMTNENNKTNTPLYDQASMYMDYLDTVRLLSCRSPRVIRTSLGPGR